MYDQNTISLILNLYYSIGALIYCGGLLIYMMNVDNIKNEMGVFSLLFFNFILSVIWPVTIYILIKKTYFTGDIKENKNG